MARGQPNSQALYAIHRRPYEWTVRIVRAGVRHERSFIDREFRGADQALVHARHWRDAVLAQHPPEHRRQRAQRQRRPAPAVAGVTAETDRYGEIKLWRAKTYLSPGHILQKTFGVSRHGANAQAMALRERQRQLQLMEGLCHVHPTEEALRSQVRTMPAPDLPLRVQCAPADVRRSTNTSGYPGVVLRRNGGRSYWTAQTTQAGRWISRSFSIQEHGDEVALLLAIMERMAQRALHEKEALIVC